MCIGAPKPPNLNSAAYQVPQRQPVLIPDNGDPSVIAALKNQKRLTSSAMILTGNGKSLGSPSVAGPLGARGL